MSLKHLPNAALIESTKATLKIAREAEVEVLRHFREIDERKLWTGAWSLYKYIALTFGLTVDQIYPRLQAMRLVNSVPEVESTRSRHIPAEVEREMEKTRLEGCQHIDEETGNRCGSRHFLQMDHIQAYSIGGSNEVENLRWLCGFHNRHRFKTADGASA